MLSLGIDFGTNTVRALLLNINTGKEEAVSSCNYPSGTNGIVLDPTNPHLARQKPEDYLYSIEVAVKKTIDAAKNKGIDTSKIIGIGIDATSSTVIPVNKELKALSLFPKFKDNVNAYAWLWKDHTSTEESKEISELASKIRPQYLEKCGGTYSSEWFFSKIYHCLKIDKQLFDSAFTWLDLPDYIPAVLCNITDNKNLKRSICAAGHKAMYDESWGGLPDKEFLSKLSPELADLRDNLYNKAYPIGETTGFLCEEWATKFGLKEGIAVSTGTIDAHSGAIGSGVGKNTLVKIIGTSSCDIMVHPKNEKIDIIPGIAGIATDSVLPGYLGIEAGQAAVGDILNWFIKNVLNKDDSYHGVLTEKAAKLKAGESGLIALDWNNGNRNILADTELTGLILGQTLHTKDYEIYRALIEATAFGSLRIIEQLEEYGVKVEKIIACGGIAKKNPLFMQIYADVINRPILIAKSEETVAIGAAIAGAYTALKNNTEYNTIEEIQQKVCKTDEKAYIPNPKEKKTYTELYEIYKSLHDSFGLEENNPNLYQVMKKLLHIKF